MFSVLIAVYDKEQPSYLRQSLDSIFNQELPPDEVVLVEDGPLNEELKAVIHEYGKKLKIVKLKENKGLGLALRKGLDHCSYDIVARMDSDDIAKPKRFRKQMVWMVEHPETDVLGSWVEEFKDTPNNVVSIRKVPENSGELLRFSRKRNPMNHPSVMFRKQRVLNAGGYRDCPLFEDYDLWVRMLQNGAIFHNLQESLLWFRLSSQLYSRRGGRHYIRKEIAFQKQMHREGHISCGRMMLNILIRTTMRALPERWRKYGYLFFLRK